MRKKLLAQPSAKESEVNHRIINAQINSDTHNQGTKNGTTIAMTKEKKPNKFENTLFLHYKHESGLSSFPLETHKIYQDSFQGSIVKDIRLIIGHRNSGNIKSELIQNRPNSSYLNQNHLKVRLLKRMTCFFLLNYFVIEIIESNLNNRTTTTAN